MHNRLLDLARSERKIWYQARMTDRTSSPAYRGVVLAMLLLVYTFNFLDRQILGILAGPI